MKRFDSTQTIVTDDERLVEDQKIQMGSKALLGCWGLSLSKGLVGELSF